MSKLKQKLNKLPKRPGVYYFYDKAGKLLYIGKAASLKSRVGTYFFKTSPSSSLRQAQGRLLVRRGESRRHLGDKTQALVDKIADIKIRKTDSVLEALILEANEIKKYLPPYNIKAKDDKSFVNIVITKEEFPRVLAARPTEDLKFEIKKVYGPYTSAKSAREALKILKKIFPFHSSKEKSEKKCLDFHIGLCPGPYAGAITKKDYVKNIQRIEAVLQGKKKWVIGDLEREMKKLAREEKYEEAAKLRNKIFSLKHIQDIALIGATEKIPLTPFFKEPALSLPKGGTIQRIEAYDISNISGQYAVGSMVVFEDGEINKNEYRKFKIKTVAQANDVAMLKEVLERRLKHKEWDLPDLILMDGGKAQVNAAVCVINKVYPPLPPLIKVGDEKEPPLINVGNEKRSPLIKGDEKREVQIAVIGAAKGPARKKLDLYFSDNARNLENKLDKKLIAHIMGEAHRFAIAYHRLIRKKGMV